MDAEAFKPKIKPLAISLFITSAVAFVVLAIAEKELSDVWIILIGCSPILPFIGIIIWDCVKNLKYIRGVGAKILYILSMIIVGVLSCVIGAIAAYIFLIILVVIVGLWFIGICIDLMPGEQVTVRKIDEDHAEEVYGGRRFKRDSDGQWRER